MKRDQAAKFVQENILGSSDVQEILRINRQRLNALIIAGKIKPIKELKRENLFWLPDIEQLKKEMILDTRTNLSKSIKEDEKND